MQRLVLNVRRVLSAMPVMQHAPTVRPAHTIRQRDNRHALRARKILTARAEKSPHARPVRLAHTLPSKELQAVQPVQ